MKAAMLLLVIEWIFCLHVNSVPIVRLEKELEGNQVSYDSESDCSVGPVIVGFTSDVKFSFHKLKSLLKIWKSYITGKIKTSCTMQNGQKYPFPECFKIEI